MEKQNDDSSEDSMEMEDMILDQEIDMVDDFVNSEEASKCKQKMKRSFAKKFTGIVKGLFSKAKNKVNQSMHKKRGLPSRDMSKSTAVLEYNNKINLIPEQDEVVGRDSVYSVGIGNIATSYYEQKFTLMEPLAKEEKLKSNIRMSTAVRLNLK